MRIKRTTASIAEADMTPMIDMVFQLIIFFMLVMNFENVQADERVKLPIDPLAAPRDEPLRHEIVVNIGFLRDKDGNKVDDTPYVMLQGDTQVDVMTYGRQNLAQEAAIARARGGQEQVQETTVSIRADSEVPTGIVQELIKLSQEAGFSKFNLKAMAAEE
jgi:biopolymer transport protein ExbD